MTEDNKLSRKEKKSSLDSIRNFLRLNTLFDTSGSDRYKGLKIRIVLLDAVLSLIPLFIVVTISYFWFQQILKDDFRNQLKWEIENTKQSIEYFLEERLSTLRFITSTYTYEELSDQKKLNDVFIKFKKEFPGIVDFGVLDADGIQRSYAGPYKLHGVDYSSQNWFNEIVIRSSYISDVFMGYRKIPHFAIAVKKEIPDKKTFWVLRVTIDVETLKKYATSINLRENDDAFIINHNGILQTTSRFHGSVLETFKDFKIIPEEKTTVKDFKSSTDNCGMCGYAPIKNASWIFVAAISSTPYAKIPNIFRNELFYITLLSILFSVAVTFMLTQTVVNRIRKSDQAREVAISEIEHSSKMASVGRLAAGVAHEINNPLAIINEKAGLMKDILEGSENLQKNKDKFLVLLNGIFDSVARCRTVTHRLLGFSRRMDLSHDLTDINDAIKEVIGFIEKEMLYRNIKLALNFKENLPRVTTDKGQIQQVFLNIINNAVDAVEEGGQIEVSSDIKDINTIRILIKDNGIGIPKDKLKHIFEPFYTTKEKDKGTGLGLSISYGIMQKLGGIILVESEVYKGTTFIIEIPVAANAVKGGGV
jgi:two-component system, NtrC family, sensor kinase